MRRSRFLPLPVALFRLGDPRAPTYPPPAARYGMSADISDLYRLPANRDEEGSTNLTLARDQLQNHAPSSTTERKLDLLHAIDETHMMTVFSRSLTSALKDLLRTRMN